MEQQITKQDLDSAVRRLDEVRDKEIQRIDEENHRQNRRLDILEDKVHDLNKLLSTIEKMATHMESIDREQKEQGERLKKMEDRETEKRGWDYRLNMIEKNVNELKGIETACEKLLQSMAQTERQQEEIEKRLHELEGRDGDMWRSALKYLLTAALAALVTFVATHLGM